MAQRALPSFRSPKVTGRVPEQTPDPRNATARAHPGNTRDRGRLALPFPRALLPYGSLAE